VSLDYSIRINGIQKIAITKLDVLDDFDEIKICVGYALNGKKLKQFPTDVQTLESVEPIYRTYQGWKTKISEVRKFRELPKQAQRYIRAMEELLKTEIWMVSVGARRDQTLLTR